MTVVSDKNVEASIGQLFGDQRCRFTIILDEQNFFARFHHPTSSPN
jgi:hypothetical protein